MSWRGLAERGHQVRTQSRARGGFAHDRWLSHPHVSQWSCRVWRGQFSGRWGQKAGPHTRGQDPSRTYECL